MSNDRSSDVQALLRGCWRDLKVAAILYTRLPLPHVGEIDGRMLAGAQRMAPLVGAGVGLIGGLGFAIAAWFGLPPLACALLAVTATILSTGAMHEDGLADAADGIGGGTAALRLEIMRDSRTGSYGVLALVLSVGLRVAALGAMAAGGAIVALIVAGAASRSALPAIMSRFDPARHDGLAAEVGRAAPETALIAVGIATAIGLILLGPSAGIAVLLAAGAGAAVVIALARRLVGGYTGDVLGAAQQAAEICALLAASAVL